MMYVLKVIMFHGYEVYIQKNPTKVDPDAVADIAVASQGSIPETSLIIQIKCPKAPMPSMIDRHIHIEIAMSGCTPICDKSKFHYCW